MCIVGGIWTKKKEREKEIGVGLPFEDVRTRRNIINEIIVFISFIIISFVLLCDMFLRNIVQSMRNVRIITKKKKKEEESKK